LKTERADQPSPAFEGHADLPGVRLWYTDTGGGGVPVVLLHANTGNADSWQYNTPALAAAGYRAIAFDRRGWGRSTPDPATGPQPGTIADDLHALAEYLQLDRFHLVGVAGGGFVAYDYALWHPERLRSLVVAASGGAIQDPALAELRAKTRLPGFQDWPFEFREVSQGYMATNPEGLERWLEIHSRSVQGGGSSMPPLRTEITFAKLETIAVPALLLPGDNDLTTPPWVMRRQAAHLPGAEFTIIPEAGHSVNWEQPDAFNRAVLDFIGKR
jgi:pimeloyl-ACP methyl ester carboxylesterase